MQNRLFIGVFLALLTGYPQLFTAYTAVVNKKIFFGLKTQYSKGFWPTFKMWIMQKTGKKSQ